MATSEIEQLLSRALKTAVTLEGAAWAVQASKEAPLQRLSRAGVQCPNGELGPPLAQAAMAVDLSVEETEALLRAAGITVSRAAPSCHGEPASSPTAHRQRAQCRSRSSSEDSTSYRND